MLPPVDQLVAKLAQRGIALPPGEVVASDFGDSAELSRELIDLIVSGRKRATAGLLWAYDHDNEPIPKAGTLEIVVDHVGEPAVVTRVTSVDVIAFDRVTAAFAAMEGEGDGSLEHWRKGHWAFFTRECRRIGREPSPDMPVACSVFEVIHALR